MTEKEQFLGVWEREFPTTIKVLKAFPAGKQDFRPHERSRSAKELAWTFVAEEKLCEGALKGAIDFDNVSPPPPATIGEAISSYERSHRELINKVKSSSEVDLNKTVKFFTGPKQMGDVRRMDVLWMMLMDSVHHRGQLSVYIREAGGKVPSIYGPSADEPWM